MKKHLILAAAVILLCSCSHNAFEDDLFRTTDDPFQDIPSADSLSLEHTVYLSWKSDDACDMFRLMRSYDSETLSFSCVYEGRGTSYTDTDLTDNYRYIYRLDKTRGGRCFEGKSYAYGYSSECRKDACEPNDTEAHATWLEYDRICNIPCVRYVTGNREVMDCDWFYVDIPPRREAHIVVSQDNLEGNKTEGARTQLKFQQPGLEGQPINQKTANKIRNTSFRTKRFYFKIYPETTGLFTDSNTTVIEYTVSLNQIINYTL